METQKESGKEKNPAEQQKENTASKSEKENTENSHSSNPGEEASRVEEGEQVSESIEQAHPKEENLELDQKPSNSEEEEKESTPEPSDKAEEAAEEKPQPKPVEAQSQPTTEDASASANASDSEGKASKPDDHSEDYEFDEDQAEEEDNFDAENATKEELLSRIRELTGKPIEEIADKKVEEVHKSFEKLIEQAKDEALKAFLEEGNDEGDFEYKGDKELVDQFFDYYNPYKEKRREYHSNLNKRREENVEKKKELLEKLRIMVDGEEDNLNIKVLKEIEEAWKEAEPVAANLSKELWANFNALRDRFYDKRSIFYELKDLDRQKNLRLKEEIVAKAESLISMESMVQAVKELKKLHEEYKHIGPIPREVRADLWERFKSISDKIHDKKREVSEDFKKVLDANLVKKKELMEKLTSLTSFASDRINEWNQRTKEVMSLKEEWQAIGPIPKSETKELSKAFWSHFKGFFKEKQKFFKEIDKKREENLAQKVALCEKVEALLKEEESDSGVQNVKQWQADWKNIGPVPRKKSNEVYERFKKACDAFFQRRRGEMADQKAAFEENLKQKSKICEEIRKLKKLDQQNENQFSELVDQWNAVGFVPKEKIKSSKKDLLDSSFSLVEHLKEGNSDYEHFRFKVEALLTKSGAMGGPRGAQGQVDKLKRQIQDLQSEVDNWKNNMQLFAQSATAEKLKEDFAKRIEEAEEKVKGLRERIKLLRD